MQHNEIAAKFRSILNNRCIDIEVDPWDRIIYNFAKNYSYVDDKSLVKAIHTTIDNNRTIKGNVWQIKER